MLNRFIGPLFECLSSRDDVARASALAALSSLVQATRGVGLQKHVVDVRWLWCSLFQIVECASQRLSADPSTLVRRASAFLLREVITASSNLFVVSFLTLCSVSGCGKGSEGYLSETLQCAEE